jgi:hypothetical protein
MDTVSFNDSMREFRTREELALSFFGKMQPPPTSVLEKNFSLLKACLGLLGSFSFMVLETMHNAVPRFFPLIVSVLAK